MSDTAVSITQFLSALSRRQWDEKRIVAYAQTLVDSQIPLEHLAKTARRLVGDLDADDITPAKLIAEAKQRVPDVAALPAPADHARWHPGEGIGGNRPPVVVATERERAKMRAQYARMAAETKRACDKSGTSRMREAVVSQLGSWMERWLRGGRACDWCRAPLANSGDLAAYLDWCMNLGAMRPTGTPLPEPKVFCASCAAGAIGELVDGSTFHPERAGSDPWERAGIAARGRDEAPF